jgi:phage shock protein E
MLKCRLAWSLALFLGCGAVSAGGCGSSDPDGTGGGGGTGNSSATGGDGGSAAAGGTTTGTGGDGGTGGGAEACTGVVAERTLVSPDELNAMMQDKDFALINVHIPYAGEIVGTDASIPYTDVDAMETFLDHRLDARVVLYCLTGPMSVTAGDELVSRGYCAVFDLEGGLTAWEAAGYPTTGG